MNNATRARGGAVRFDIEQCNPTRNRPVLQANGAMKQRLNLLLWTFRLTEARHG